MAKQVPPLCSACPECGVRVAKKQRSSRLVSFKGDCKCTRCGTVYTLPTPRWAGWTFLVIGVLILAWTVPVKIFATTGWLAPSRPEFASESGWVGKVGLALVVLMGVVCIWQGVRFLREKPVEPPKFG